MGPFWVPSSFVGHEKKKGGARGTAKFGEESKRGAVKVTAASNGKMLRSSGQGIDLDQHPGFFVRAIWLG